MLLLIGGAILYVIASQKMSGTRVAIAIASFMLCTLPALVMGPVN
ncbi:MAG: hypothetical protein Q8L14_36915 [Myxococcales bacterium]|nr:hypothetical protein [Myxococcales bacterium]